MLTKLTALTHIEFNGNTFEADGVAAQKIRDAMEQLGKADALGSFSDMEEEDSEAEEEEEEDDANDLAAAMSKVKV